MSVAFWMLLGAAAATPALMFFPGAIAEGILLGYLAIATGILALSIRPGESDHLVKLGRPVAMLAGFILLWMVIQVIPMPIPALGHPAWTNAQSALGETFAGSITVDVGATLIATLRFCGATGLLFIATATSIDRNRAEALLTALATIVCLFAIALVASELMTRASLIAAPAQITAALVTVTNLGVVISAANILRTIERYETRKSSQSFSATSFGIRLGLAAGGFAICCLAAIFFSTRPTLFSSACGFLLFLMIVLIRRLGFRIWESVGLLAIVAAALGLVASLNAGTGELTIRFAQLTAPARAIVSTMIANSPVAGNGAGTLSSIMPIYQDAAGDLTGNAMTTAAIAVIEFGRTVTWLIIISAFALNALLFKAALTRGRDSFYATAGASCLLIMLLESFCDSGLMTMPGLFVAVCILGLAVAQRLSRTDASRFAMA